MFVAERSTKFVVVNGSGRYESLLQCPSLSKEFLQHTSTYEGWNFNSGNYLFTTDTK